MFVNAVAFAVSGEQKYFDRSRADLLNFVNNTRCWDRIENGKCRRDRLVGQNILKVGTTYDILYQNLSATDRQTVRNALFEQACKQYEASTWGEHNLAQGWSNWWLTSYMNNHFTSSLAGLAIAGLVLEPEEGVFGQCESKNYLGETLSSDPSDWVDYAIERFDAAKIVWDQVEDGHWPEGDIYQLATFAELTVTIFALDTLKGTQYTTSPIIKNFTKYYLYDSLPDKRWNNLLNTGDANLSRRETFRYVRELRYLASQYDDSLAQGLADQIIADLGGRPKPGGDKLDAGIFENFS
jgi:hypothetical protein